MFEPVIGDLVARFKLCGDSWPMLPLTMAEMSVALLLAVPYSIGLESFSLSTDSKRSLRATFAELALVGFVLANMGCFGGVWY